MKKPMTGISGAAMARLQAHSWPGNVRELENAMERAVALERTPSILPESLPEAPARRRGGRRAAPIGAAAGAAAATGSAVAARQGLRSRAARAAPRAGIHRRGAAAVERRQGQGRRAAGHELPVVPLLHEEVQPEVGPASQPCSWDSKRQSAAQWPTTDCQSRQKLAPPGSRFPPVDFNKSLLDSMLRDLTAAGRARRHHACSIRLHRTSNLRDNELNSNRLTRGVEGFNHA